jgi:hypothetical protein
MGLVRIYSLDDTDVSERNMLAKIYLLIAVLCLTINSYGYSFLTAISRMMVPE